MNAKKKKHFKKAKRAVLMSILGSFLGIFVIAFFCINHLFQIQTPERLKYIKDYTDFTLSVAEMPGCENELYTIYQREGEIYNGICIYNVYVNYGTVKAPLEMVLKENYITLKDIKSKLGKIEEEGKEQIHYEYRRSDEKDGNYHVTIVPKNYQHLEMTEITFEPYKEQTIDENSKMEGHLEIQ